MILLNGHDVANKVRHSLDSRIIEFRARVGRAPQLTVIIVGDDGASHIYVKNKKIACESIGISSNILALPHGTKQAELNQAIENLNKDSSVDGILVQFPLPAHLNADEVLRLLTPTKDVDGLTYASLGYFFAGKPLVNPCTPQGIMSILEHYQISVEGMKAVVIGRSNIVGKPMAHMLMEAHATVTLCHSRTRNLSEITRTADLVVVAAGKAEFLGKDDFKKDAIVIDVGIHRRGANKKICGDVRFNELADWVRAATPVPGGVGPMTIASLLQNTCLLAEQRAGIFKTEKSL